MAITPFDTHKYVRRLEQAGMPLEQAEVQAEVLTEAFMVNLESLVTKDYFDSRLDSRLEILSARLEAKIDGNFRIQLWINAVITAAVIVPYLERMLAF